MMTPPRRAGTRGPRWLLLTSALFVATGLSAYPPERPKSDEFNRFESYRSGNTPVGDAGSKTIFEKVARYFAGQLSDAGVQKDRMSQLVQDSNRRLLLPPTNPYPRLKDEQKKFVDEYGKALIEALEGPALNDSKPIVRMNAARMAAEVGRMGYDGAAELFLKILAKPKESDAVRLYALQGLHNLFAIAPDAAIAPQKTIFQKKNVAEPTELEGKCIQALIDFITQKRELGPEITPEEIAAIQY